MFIHKLKPKRMNKFFGVGEGADTMPNMGHMRWKGEWQDRQYFKNDVVVDDDWLMIANTDTNDRAAPQASGPTDYILEDIPTWATPSNLSVVYSGHKYTFTKGVWVNAIRVWVPTLTDDTNYRVIIAHLPPGATIPIISTIEEPVLNLDSWTIVRTFNSVVTTGTQIIIYIDALNSGANTVVTGGWSFNGQSNNPTLVTGQWEHNNANTLIRVHDVDLDTVNRRTELLGFVPGTTIQFSETSQTQNSITYRVVNAPIPQTGYIEYDVTIVDQGVLKPTVGQPSTMTATVPIALATDYVIDVDRWSGFTNPNFTVEGILQYDGVDQPGNELNAFGVDLAYTPAIVSPNWDYMSTGSGDSGGDSAVYGGGSAKISTSPMPVYRTSQNFGPRLSVAEIESVLPGRMRAYSVIVIMDRKNAWSVFYDGVIYRYRRITKAE